MLIRKADNFTLYIISNTSYLVGEDIYIADTDSLLVRDDFSTYICCDGPEIGKIKISGCDATFEKIEIDELLDMLDRDIMELNNLLDSEFVTFLNYSIVTSRHLSVMKTRGDMYVAKEKIKSEPYGVHNYGRRIFLDVGTKSVVFTKTSDVDKSITDVINACMLLMDIIDPIAILQ